MELNKIMLRMANEKLNTLDDLSLKEQDEYVLHSCWSSISEASNILDDLIKSDKNNDKYKEVLEKLKDCHKLLGELLGDENNV